MRRVVDLPQPEGPNQNDKFLVLDVEVEVADSRHAAGVHLVDVLQGYTCHNEFLLTKIRNPVGQHHTCEWFLLLGHCRYYTCFSPNRK